MNKKVLLHERKRHTARHVASPWGEGGSYLGWVGGGILTLAGGVPTLVGGGYLPWLGRYLPWPGGTYLG